MENNGENEIKTSTPEKQLSPEYIRQTARNLMVAIHELVLLKNPENKDVFTSKKRAYQWSSYKEYRNNQDNNGISDIEFTEDTFKNNIRKDIMLGPNLIAVRIQNFKEGTKETHTNSVKALNEVKQVMGHLSDNIKPTTTQKISP
jgi:hypothetical protein